MFSQNQHPAYKQNIMSEHQTAYCALKSTHHHAFYAICTMYSGTPLAVLTGWLY